MRLTHATNKAIRYACMNFHYAKAVPVNTLGYNVYNDNNEWCGVILFGNGANKNSGVEYNLCQGSVLELVRVALNGKQECTSQAVAMALKQLKKDCPLCELVVSYADVDQSHLGTIYQATNWIYVGKTGENGLGGWIVNGKRVHNKTISDRIKAHGGGARGLTRLEYLQKYYDADARKFISKGKRKYLMPLTKRMRKKILPLAKPYPKEDANWVKIDRTQFHNNTEENTQT